MLKKIIAATEVRVKENLKNTPLQVMKAKALLSPKPLTIDLSQSSDLIIAEIKFASPSLGAISRKRNILDITEEYIQGGANAISILTEPNFFMGESNYIQKVRTKYTTLPILQKDFFISSYQIYEARLIGSTFILLMASVLTKDKLSEYLNLALDLGLTPILEVHNEDEMQLALELKAPIIGVNNRNLNSLEVNTSTSKELSSYISDKHLFISESGLSNQEEIKALRSYGYRGFLIGSHLMKSKNPSLELQDLLCE